MKFIEKNKNKVDENDMFDYLFSYERRCGMTDTVLDIYLIN